MTETNQAANNEPSKSGSNLLSIISFVLAAVAVVFIPILFGGAAIITAAVGITRKERLSKIALIVAIVATIAGFVLGALVLSASA
ncbi:hypothetical protein K0651_08495 [Ornithinimicrobium sp. Arc0846-15]|nr:hypothetical protein [Ornithinimicrobium laminariae]